VPTTDILSPPAITAGETCALLLVIAGGRTPEPAAIRGDAGLARSVAGFDGIERKDPGQVGSETYPQGVGVRRQKWVANGAISAVLLWNLGRWRQTG
jgi:hypothetical protein